MPGSPTRKSSPPTRGRRVVERGPQDAELVVAADKPHHPTALHISGMYRRQFTPEPPRSRAGNAGKTQRDYVPEARVVKDTGGAPPPGCPPSWR